MEFIYHNPKSIQELVTTLNSLENYALLAGGTDLLVKMKEQLLRPMPQAIVDINGIDSFKGIAASDGYIVIGSLVTHNELTKSSLVRQKALALLEAADQVGSPQIRNVATVGGNICNGSPAADTVPALIALDATVEIHSQNGQQEMPLKDIFTGPGKTCLLPGQFIAKVKVRPIHQNEGAAFLKFGKRKALAIAIINGAVWLRLEGNIISDVKIVLGSVAPTAVRLPAVEQWLIGKAAEPAIFAQAGAKAAAAIKPIDDVRCNAVHRKHLASIVVARCLAVAMTRAQERCNCE
jgi:carbon-monoxide dehydrogenase medium subunit